MLDIVMLVVTFYIQLVEAHREITFPWCKESRWYTMQYKCNGNFINGVRVTWSLVLCVCFVDRCLSFCTFSFGHCVVCSSSICGFWLPLWYLQTLLSYNIDLDCILNNITEDKKDHRIRTVSNSNRKIIEA